MPEKVEEVSSSFCFYNDFNFELGFGDGDSLEWLSLKIVFLCCMKWLISISKCRERREERE